MERITNNKLIKIFTCTKFFMLVRGKVIVELDFHWFIVILVYRFYDIIFIISSLSIVLKGQILKEPL